MLYFIALRIPVMASSLRVTWPPSDEFVKKQKLANGTWEGHVKLTRVPAIGECVNVGADLPEFVRNIIRTHRVTAVEHLNKPDIDEFEDVAIVAIQQYADDNADEFVKELINHGWSQINE